MYSLVVENVLKACVFRARHTIYSVVQSNVAHSSLAETLNIPSGVQKRATCQKMQPNAHRLYFTNGWTAMPVCDIDLSQIAIVDYFLLKKSVAFI